MPAVQIAEDLLFEVVLHLCLVQQAVQLPFQVVGQQPGSRAELHLQPVFRPDGRGFQGEDVLFSGSIGHRGLCLLPGAQQPGRLGAHP